MINRILLVTALSAACVVAAWRSPMLEGTLGSGAWTANVAWLGPLGGSSVPTQDREQARQLLKDGNYAEAYKQFEALCLSAETDAKLVSSDLTNAIQCLNNLGQISKFDDLVEGTVKVQGANWELLQTAAEAYVNVEHNGFLISGEFERGGHRGGGQPMNAVLRDRARALQLMNQAMPLANQSDLKKNVSSFYLSLANQLLFNQGFQQAWRLQTLTDLNELPDLEEGYSYFYYNQNPGAPVDEEGKPVFYGLPDSWEAAQSDGERWRWSLSMAIENDPQQLNAVRYNIATFAHAQFGVQTLQTYGWTFRGEPESDGDEDESGTYALHTLGENETIAKLANGVKRFELPDDYNFIKIFRTIVSEPRTGQAESALTQLAQIFENRRQYEAAAEIWSQSIRDFGDRNNWKQDRLDQIVKNWGRFDMSQPQPSGGEAELSFVFRNAKSVSLTAQEIDIEQLLSDVKEYIRSRPQRLDWQTINLQNLGYRMVQGNGDKYLKKEKSEWTEELEPRPHHWDRRVTLQTPLKKAGAYWVTASMENGNQTSIVLWIADTSLVRYTLDGKSLYYVADAKTGKPIPRINVEFFGYRQEAVRDQGRNTGRTQIITSNFAERTNEDGITMPSPKDEETNYNWLVTARDGEGRLAYLGFNGVWHGQYYDQQYRQAKTIFITDRPVYRPGQKVNIKAWFRYAQYDRGDESQFANHSVNITLRGPRGDEIFNKALKTDAYGGVTFDYEVPSDAMLGQYMFTSNEGGQLGGNTFRVEEYKKPEFEVTIDAPKEPVALGETITATINAKYYFGAPVTTATVKYKVLRQKHNDQWYPHRYWDWCYGPGYWWFCYDYTWYPGFSDWVGCKMPYPWWWPVRQDPPEVIAEREVPINPDGTVSVEIDTSVAKEIHGNDDHEYTITAEVRDQSRRTIVGQGKVLVAREPFKVFTWLDRGYYQTGDTIDAHFLAQTIDEKPVKGSGTLKLLKITYDPSRKPIETPVQEWLIDTNDEGRADHKFVAASAGQYRLSYTVSDDQGHAIEGGYIFTVIGEKFDSVNYRFNKLELIPQQASYQPGDTVSLQVNSDQEDATILLFVRPSNGVYTEPRVIRMKGKSTVVELDVDRKDMPNFFVEAMTVAEGEVFTQTREIIVPPEDRVLNVAVNPSKEEYKPGEKASVDIQLTELNGENFQGTTVVTIYDKAVEYISGGSNVPEIREFFWKWRRSHNPNHQSNLERYEGNLVKDSKDYMQFIGVFGATLASDLDAMDESVATDTLSAVEGAAFGGGAAGKAGGRGGAMGAPAGEAMMADSGMAAPMAMSRMAAMDADGLGIEGSDAGGQPPLVEPTVRSQFADTALWVGVLDTDETGHAKVDLTMPENLTTWKVKVWGMGHGTRVGSGEAEVITTKNLLVRMQAPRFFVETDEVMLSANVHNYLEETKQVTVRLEMDGANLVALDELVQQVSVPADGETRVDWRVRVAKEGTARIRMFALSDEESDAMEMSFPVYVHGMLKQEAWAGTVRRDADRAQVSFTVPSDRRVSDSRLIVRYSPTLAGAMVDALPYLAEYPYGCTEQTLNRWLPTVITQRVLIDMKLDLEAIKNKRTNLNAQELGEAVERAEQWKRFDRNPVFDREEVDRMVKEGLKQLAEMQVSDGGWGWFSGWGERSFPHTTAVVVHGLQVARQNDVAIVPGMLENGIAWLERYQAQELEKLQNAKEEIKPFKLSADNLDAMVYMILADEKRESEGMREFLYRDRNNLTVYGKSMYALGLLHTEDAEKLNMVKRNIDQFLVQDAENETAYLDLPDSVYWWYWYGNEIEANAYYLKLLSRTDPQGETAGRMVKYLLNNRKHATYWASTRDTALCVEAFADYLSKTDEANPEMTVEIWLDGEKKKEVEINSENLFSFDGTYELQGDGITDGEHVLEVRRQGSGPVYFNVYSINFTTEDDITAAGLEVKVARKYFKLVPVDKEIDVRGSRGQATQQKVEKYDRVELENLSSVESGDLVEIELTIDSKNDYEYLLFEDYKPAGFEPVDLRSGYNGNALNAYAEFRDNRVTFFVRQLARGTHSVSYRMRAEIPGQFSALPARVEAMYAPELRGNSDELKLKVDDKPVASSN